MVRKLLVLILLASAVGLALQALSHRGQGSAGPGEEASSEGGSPEVGFAPGLEGDAGRPGGGAGPEGALRWDLRPEDSGQAGQLIAQVVEVDECIDPTGTRLILSAGGKEYSTEIQKDGGATFSGVRFDSGGTDFTLRTAVPDRKCFPERFTIGPGDVVGRPPAAGVSVALVHLHLLSGTVRDASSREPVEEASLEVDSFAVSTAVTDQAGRYELNLPEPAGTLIVRARGYQEFLWNFPEQTDLGPWLPGRRDFELLPDHLTSWLRVAAVAEPDRPAAGAELRIVELHSRPFPRLALAGLKSDERNTFLGSLESEVNAFGSLAGADGPVPERLDENGAALLRVKLPGDLQVTVRTGNLVATSQIEILPGTQEQVELTLLPGVTLEVRVVCSGRRLQQVPVALHSLADGRMERVVSDEVGWCRFEGLLPGRDVVLSVPGALERTGDWTAQSRRIRLPAAATEPHRVELELARDPLMEVEGRTVDASTRQPVIAWIVAENPTSDPPLQAIWTDGLGRFLITAVRAGDRLTFRADGYRDGTLDASQFGDSEVEVLLEPVRAGDTRLELRVVDATGKPLEDASVWTNTEIISETGRILARMPGESYRSTSRDGMLHLSAQLRPGERFVVDAAGTSMDGELSGRIRMEVSAGFAGVVELVLRPAASIAGTSEWPEGGSSLASVRVSWLSFEREATGGAWISTRGEPDGSFLLKGVPPGPGYLVAEAPFHGGLIVTSVPAAGLEHLRVDLEPLVDVPLEVLDARSRVPLRFASLQSPFDPGNAGSTTVPVPLGGQVKVRVSAPGYLSRELTVGAQEGRSDALVVELERVE
ncbi:MAG: hypothetical protein V2A76_19205 [Planctomycetota bacterium]